VSDEATFMRLAAHPGVPRLVRGDARFAAVLDESMRRALRAAHLGEPLPRQFDTTAAVPAATAAVPAATAAVLLLDRIAVDPLEVQVAGLVRSLVPLGGRQATDRVLAVTGWGGGAPMPATQAAARHGVGREWVARARRDVLARLPRRPWVPALDAAGALLSCLAPAHEASRQLREAGITDRIYSPAALLDLAERLGFRWQLELVRTRAGDVIASRRGAARLRHAEQANLRIRSQILAAARGRRIVHDSDLPAAARRTRWYETAAAGDVPDVVALPDGWLAILAPASRGAFDRLLRTMLAVTSSLRVDSLNDGLRRGMAASSLRWSVPDAVLLAYLAYRSDVYLEEDRIAAVDPPSADALTAMDRRLVGAVRDSPSGTLRYHQVVEAYAAAGGSPAAAKVLLARSAALERVDRGLYTARGDAAALRTPARQG
jgi:hypothetical protein